MFAFDFDPSLPTIAVSEFSAGERRVRAGEAFDWRAHGMTEIEVIPLLRAGFLRQERAIAAPAESRTVDVSRLKPGPYIAVETPEQRKRKR